MKQAGFGIWDAARGCVMVAALAAMLPAGRAWGLEYYVATNGLDNGSNDGLSWSEPLLTISNALTQPSVTVVTVSNGAYNTTAPILITNGVNVRSFQGGLSGASNTVVNGSGTFCPIFSISHASAAVQGFTISGGRGSSGKYGGGVAMIGGLLSDCIVTNNGGYSWAENGFGGGISITGGTVSNCLVTANGWRGGVGNGIYMNGSSALVTHCRITDHKTSWDRFGNNAVYGGGVYINNGTLRNCLIAGNEGRKFPLNSSSGGGVYMKAAGAKVESCTIVSNSATATGGGGGVYRVAGTVRNSIVYFNTGNAGADDNINTTTGLGYCCTTNAGTTANGNITGDPLFVNLAGGDYSLLKTSPCIDLGDNQSWMTGAKDLAGNDRLQRGTTRGVTVDMGAYETYVAPAGTVIMCW